MEGCEEVERLPENMGNILLKPWTLPEGQAATVCIPCLTKEKSIQHAIVRVQRLNTVFNSCVVVLETAGSITHAGAY